MRSNEIHTFFMAPIQGATDDIYRTTYAEYFTGIESAIAPFLSTASGSQIRPNAFQRLQPEYNFKMKVIPQLLGNDPDHFMLFVRHLKSLGYKQVNWNLGCPFPVVVRKKKGAGLLPYPEHIDQFLMDVFKDIDIQISVKCRLGYHDTYEILKLMDVFNRYPLSQLVIHPRTGVQQYKGKPDLDAFEKCLTLSRHPVVYSGDLFDQKTFFRMAERFPNQKRWMLGRGVLRNPFLPSMLLHPDTIQKDPIRVFQKFHDRLYERYAERLSGPGHLLNRMKEHWGYWAHGFVEGRKILKSVRRITKTSHYDSVIRSFFKSGIEVKFECDHV
ncbi:tRNA-dihydrouridine synthase family protein [candidate division KSB1 bacterium]|nr:tRNA-dihydrouridine synthase family protein [candidate division KSB1 bacterium]